MGMPALASPSLMTENPMMKRGIRIEKPSHLESKPSESPSKENSRLPSFFVILLILSYLLAAATLSLFFLFKSEMINF